VDIVPSVVGLLGMHDAQHASWGRSLFRTDADPAEAFAVFKLSAGGRAVALARGDDLLVLGSARGQPLLMKYDMGWPPSVRPMSPAEAEHARPIERELKAYIQAALTDVSTQRAGPVTPGAASAQ
jgi:hypothetical protein